MAAEHPFETWLRFLSPTIRFPGSGDIGHFRYQPYTEWEAPSLYRGNQQIEHTIYREVASPGSQLGTLIDAVETLVDRLSGDHPDLEAEPSIEALRRLAGEVKDTKESAGVDVEKALRRELDKLAAMNPAQLQRILADYAER